MYKWMGGVLMAGVLALGAGCRRNNQEVTVINNIEAEDEATVETVDEHPDVVNYVTITISCDNHGNGMCLCQKVKCGKKIRVHCPKED